MHGVSFGEVHSFHNLRLILSPFTPPPAVPQTNFLKVPGRDGTLDLTEANGEVKFNDRELMFTFTISPDDVLSFDERLAAVSNTLNGKRCKITLDRDPDYYWEGRCAVEQHQRDKNIGKIVVKATVNPYKLKQRFTVVPVALSAAANTVVLENGRMSAVPTIECSHGATVVFGGKTHELSAGAGKILDIRLLEGKNLLTVSGTGTITFIWREGAL